MLRDPLYIQGRGDNVCERLCSHRSWDLMFPQVEVKVLRSPPSSVFLLAQAHTCSLLGIEPLTLRESAGSQSSCRWPGHSKQHIDGSSRQNQSAFS